LPKVRKPPTPGREKKCGKRLKRLVKNGGRRKMKRTSELNWDAGGKAEKGVEMERERGVGEKKAPGYGGRGGNQEG